MCLNSKNDKRERAVELFACHGFSQGFPLTTEKSSIISPTEDRAHSSLQDILGLRFKKTHSGLQDIIGPSDDRAQDSLGLTDDRESSSLLDILGLSDDRAL